SSLRGAEVSFGCGVLASGKALVFNRDSRRHLVTAPLDSSQARYLQFTLRLGSRSTLSSCPAPDQAGEGVLLHYSTDNGITWTLLQHYAYQGFHDATRFRWIQNYYGEQDEWALDDIYIGQQCPNMCHGHGWCDHGHCRSAFEVTEIEMSWTYCNQADSREEGVLLQYSNDGGISWGLIAEMYFTDFTKPRFVHYELPLASKTPCTRFRWWQPLHSGEGYDQWAIDDVIILSEREKHIIPIASPTLPQVHYCICIKKEWIYSIKSVT
uniref:Reelin n=1 Tax=Hippocampus comes TaxID=109280 RepID=A0A3Q3E4M8_HIPCM